MPWNSTWDDLGGPPPAGRCLHGVAAVATGAGALEVFTLASDCSFFHVGLRDGVQSAWHNFDAHDANRIPWIAKPAACTTGIGTQFDLFCIDRFGNLMHNNSSGPSWEIVEHKTFHFSPPGVVTTSPGVFDLFLFSVFPDPVARTDVDAALQHLAMVETISGVELRGQERVEHLPAIALQSSLEQAPAAVGGPGGRLDVFWISQGFDRAILHARRSGSGWQTESLGGVGIRGVAACSRFTVRRNAETASAGEQHDGDRRLRGSQGLSRGAADHQTTEPDTPWR